MNISFNTLLKLRGFPIDKAKNIFDNLLRIEDYSEWHKEKCFNIFNHHYKNNRHYKTLINTPVKKWEDIPIMEKKYLRVNTELNKKLFNKHYLRNTSGSTGTPFYYALDHLSHALTWTLFTNRYNKLGISLNDKQARFFGSPSNYKQLLTEKLKDYISNRHRFSLLDLSNRTFKNWINQINNHKLEYIYGYSFPIISFCHFLKNHNITLRDICPTLKAIIVTAETCSEQDERLMKESTQLPIANEYGASELGIIGFGETNKWRISDELLYVEIVDENNNVVPNGQLGRIICTSLFNKGTPFIRYDIGDLGALEEINGKRYLTKLEGRKEELMFLPSGSKLPGDTFFYYIIKDFNAKFEDLIEYRVIQKTLTEFDVLIVSESILHDKDKSYFIKLIQDKINEPININIKQVQHIDRSSMGKFRRFISTVSN